MKYIEMFNLLLTRTCSQSSLKKKGLVVSLYSDCLAVVDCCFYAFLIPKLFGNGSSVNTALYLGICNFRGCPFSQFGNLFRASVDCTSHCLVTVCSHLHIACP